MVTLNPQAWSSTKLGEIVSIETGKLNSNAAKPDGKYPFFTCSRETFCTDTYSFDCECVLLAGNNAAGIYPIKYFAGKFDAYQRTYVIRSKDERCVKNRFLYYVLQPKLGFLKSISTGAATKFLTLGILKDLEISIPQISIQEEIVNVLSAYDDLIENNARRIRILEEMAQSLYREWFVYFRFPGHEKVKLVNSPLGEIPDGWEVKSFGELFDIRYGKNLSTKEISDNGIYPVYGAGSVIGYYDKSICSEKVALITCRGNGSGTVWRTRGAAFITNNSLLLLPNDKNWEFFWVELLAKHSNINGVISGSAQPQITIEGLSKVSAMVPQKNIVSYFCDLVQATPSLVDSLYLANENLRHTRDLLLPKLINGKLRV